MALTVSSRSTVASDRPAILRNGPDSSAPAGLDSLEANSDRPEVQAVIAEAIRSGKVRVLPDPDCPRRVKLRHVPPGERVEPPRNRD